MKTKNVWMPILAFVVAIGMAFATTPINQYETQVWMKTHEKAPCDPTTCVTIPNDPCGVGGLLFDDPICESSIEEAYQP